MTAAALHYLPTWNRQRPSADNRDALFDALVETYGRDLHHYALWLCHCPDTAQDLVQDTLLRAWRSLGQLRDLSSARPWLLTILRRENARRFERFSPDLCDIETQPLAGAPDHDNRIEALVLRRALGELAPEYREPLLMQVLEGLNYSEIAERMGLTEAAVTTRLFRARQKMQTMLGAA